MNNRKKPSVFDLAKPPSSIYIEVDTDAVRVHRPDWSQQQAAKFLMENGQVIAEAMIERGREVLNEILPPRSGHEN